MKSLNFTNRLRPAALALVAALVLPGLFLGVNAHPAASAAQNPNFSTEAQALESFGNALAAYIEQENGLRKKATLTRAELAALRAKGDDLKRRLASVQQTFRSFTKKLQDYGRWQNIDNEIFARIKDAQLQSLLKSEGGPKQIWTDIANNVNGFAREIEADTQNLSNKVREQSLKGANGLQDRAARVAYHPAPVFWKSLKCRVAIAVLTVKLVVCNCNPEDIQADVNQANAACKN